MLLNGIALLHRHPEGPYYDDEVYPKNRSDGDPRGRLHVVHAVAQEEIQKKMMLYNRQRSELTRVNTKTTYDQTVKP